MAVDSADVLYRRLVSHWKNPERVVIGGSEPTTPFTDPRQLPTLPDLTHRMMYLDLVTYLPDDILVKVDRASMSVGLEARVPLLDHRIVEFSWRLPLSMKVGARGGKHILKQVLSRYVPRELVERPKTGFGIPIAEWLRGPLREWADDLLDEKTLREEGFFDPRPIRTKWTEHVSGRRNWHYYLWDILIFESWLREQRARADALQ
jgi:asparagine synthase (glutamine-hydrolysing)